MVSRQGRLIVLALLSFAGPASAQEAGLGRALYRANCESCHGAKGAGDGWLAKYLTRKPTNLARLAAGKPFPREEVLRVIDGRREVEVHGPRDMPVWGERFQARFGSGQDADKAVKRRVEALADYLATLRE